MKVAERKTNPRVLRPKNAVDTYFKKVAMRLKKFFDQMSASFRRRFGGKVNETFAQYVDAVVETNVNNRNEVVPNFAETQATFVGPRKPPFAQKILVRYIEEQTVTTKDGKKEQLKEFVAQRTQDINDFFFGPKPLNKLGRAIKEIIVDADGVMRGLDDELGPEIAEMFYVQAQMSGKGGRMGFLGTSSQMRAKYQTQLENKLGKKWDSPEIKLSFELAASSTPTANLRNENAIYIRKFLEDLHSNYIAKAGHGINIGRLPNYFPIALELNIIQADPVGFVNRIMAEKEAAGVRAYRPAIEMAVQKILARPGEGTLNDPEILQATALEGEAYVDMEERIKANEAFVESAQAKAAEARVKEENKRIQAADNLNPNASVEAIRQLTSGIENPQVALKGFLKEPEVAFISYVHRVIKRVEWNKATRAPNGSNTLVDLLDALDAKDPTSTTNETTGAVTKGEKRRKAEQVINTYLGYLENPLHPALRFANSYLQLFNFVTLLPFAAVSSIPDLAGPFINNKGFEGVTSELKNIISGIMTGDIAGDQRRARQLAEDLGIVTNEAISTTLISEAEQDFMDTKARQLSNAFFYRYWIEHVY